MRGLGPVSTTTNETLSPLIDADGLVYRCGFAADSQMKAKFKESNPGIADDLLQQMLDNVDYVSYALHNTREAIDDICNEYRGEPRLFISGDGNFREQLATILPYKGNRTTRKPKYYKDIKNYLVTYFNAEVVHGQEADDALAQAQWAAKDKSTIIVTQDKDLDMVPGHHYNWVKKEYYYISLEYANMRLFWQMLEGDSSDNIPGIKGVGPKTITKLFEGANWNIDLIRDVVKAEYRKQYGDTWEQAYHEVGNLLWMRRREGQECPLL